MKLITIRSALLACTAMAATGAGRTVHITCAIAVNMPGANCTKLLLLAHSAEARNTRCTAWTNFCETEAGAYTGQEKLMRPPQAAIMSKQAYRSGG